MTRNAGPAPGAVPGTVPGSVEPPALQVQDLHVHLDSEAGVVHAVDALALSIARGETFALVGESGCGKSMTALALLRLLPEAGRIVAGSIRAAGEELLTLPEARMRAVRGGRVAMIFQEPATSLNPVMRVGDQLREAIEAHTPLRGADARRKAIDWLRRVGIPEPERRIDDYPFRMSGGQKQRVMIAMALAGEPDLIVADEPTTALDVTIQAQILELLKDLQRERGVAMLLITHDLAVVRDMAQTVALMYAGEVVEVAGAADFFARPRHPYAGLLLQALPDGRRRGQALAAIPGLVPALTQRFDACRFAPRCRWVQPACRQAPPPLVGLPDAEGAGRERAVRCLRAAEDLDFLPPTAEGAAAASPREGADSGAAAGGGCAPTAVPLLQVQGLSVHFPIRSGLLQRETGRFTAVQGVDFALPRGRTLALVGESGCGKTTSGKAVVQLLRGTARVEGRALLDGQDLFTLQGDALRAARRRIQMVFQDPFSSLNPRLRVLDILEEGLLTLRPELDAAARRSRLEALVERVGLRREALQRWPHEFSGGQRQRIAIARALAVEPEVIVCDEPTSALDVSVQAQILNLLDELQRDTGVALLFITHNLGVVEYFAHEVAVMHRGRIVEAGPVEAVMRAPQQDYTRALLAAVPRL
ncbi:MAG: ABC transporter ATP-binding protein [Burkholderiaceae bacterium]|nr:ABC transporter ATP-binding protein [Burkholderiaceae bacterium]